MFETKCVRVSISIAIAYHSQVPDLLHDPRPEGLQGLLGIAAPSSKRIGGHPLLCCTEGMTGEERGGSTRLVRRKTEIQRCDLMIQAGHRIQCQSDPGLSCPERFTCVRTTYPITAYNYNTVKSKIEPQRTSILVLVGYWHAHHQAGCKLPDYEWLYHLQAHSSSSSVNTSVSCGSQLLPVTRYTEDNAKATDLRYALGVCVTEKQFLNNSDQLFCGRTPWTHAESCTMKEVNCNTHTHTRM